MSNATIAYNENPVLRAISFTIKAGERVGIVGRTGAGKSTLINGLYRLVNLASGQIRIDDVDIANVGLHNLRRRLTIIPQNPQLFTGSVRYNLDPLQLKSDDELYRALKDVKLAERLDNNLYVDVSAWFSIIFLFYIFRCKKYLPFRWLMVVQISVQVSDNCYA